MQSLDNFSDDFTKVDIINSIAKSKDYHKYLEICTPSTGLLYKEIDRIQLKICNRWMYNCPIDYDDGMDIDFRTESLNYYSKWQELKKEEIKYDIILVDPWHEYETSYRDIEIGFELLKEGGIMVVHDCFPKNEAIISSQYITGEWCGLTFQAYIDFVLKKQKLLTYHTIDRDYGCGIVTKKSILYYLKHLININRLTDNHALKIINLWKESRQNPNKLFFLLQEHSDLLLRIISYKSFNDKYLKPNSKK